MNEIQKVFFTEGRYPPKIYSTEYTWKQLEVVSSVKGSSLSFVVNLHLAGLGGESNIRRLKLKSAFSHQVGAQSNKIIHITH